MCGIAGIIGSGEQNNSVELMVESMEHRGPDDHGIESQTIGDRKVVLGNTRLAIIDLSPAGHMPMLDPETGNWITYNGEVYNFLELRKELAGKGETFRSGTDTEVILKAYKHWGRKCVQRLRGMFAFAIWDKRRNEMFLVRDRVGKKPLYYYQINNGAFLFASEVRALLASELVSRRLEPDVLASYLLNGFVVSPLTMVKDVYSILPGHWMRVGLNGEIIEIKRYWQVPFGTTSKKVQPYLQDEVRTQLEEAVRLRLISDVPLGAFLSGGLDSSAIVALMAKGGGNVWTFSITFEEEDYDESPFSNWVAENFHTKHTEIRLRNKDFQAWLPDALDAMDQPTHDGINTYFVSRAAKENGMTVALSGTGGDEIFGGYPFVKWALWLFYVSGFIKRLPYQLVKLVTYLLDHQQSFVAGPLKTLELLYDRRCWSNDRALASYQSTQILYPNWLRRKLISSDLVANESNNWFGLPQAFLEFIKNEYEGDNPIDQLSKAVFRIYLGERSFKDIDTMSMGVSLEVRSPFTDHLFLESAWKVSGRLRCQGIPNKPFLWDLVRPYLGENYPLRKKQGFIFPFQVWLKSKSSLDRINAALTNKILAEQLGFRFQAIEKVLRNFSCPRSSIPWSRVWSLFVLFQWCERHRVFL